MDNISDYEERNISYLLQGEHIPLTEALWCKHFELTSKGPFSLEPESHKLLKAAYQRIKQLERQTNGETNPLTNE